MPRRGFVPKRDVLPDPVYQSKLVTKLINNIMYDGKKGVAQKIVYDAFAAVQEKTGKKKPVKSPWMLLTRQWKTLCPSWKLKPAVLVVLTTRCRSK